MSRSGYSEDIDDNWALIRYRGMVASAIKGKRGQAFMRDLVDALDSLPEKRLIAGALEDHGAVCAIGSVGIKRGVDMSNLDPEDAEAVAAKFDIAEPLAREIVYMNDEGYHVTPEARWRDMRAWAVGNLKHQRQP